MLCSWDIALCDQLLARLAEEERRSQKEVVGFKEDSQVPDLPSRVLRETRVLHFVDHLNCYSVC